MASGIGPIVGGALAHHKEWRWLFCELIHYVMDIPFIASTDLNIPICGVAGLIMVLFLRVRTPPGTLREKLRQIDWM